MFHISFLEDIKWSS